MAPDPTGSTDENKPSSGSPWWSPGEQILSWPVSITLVVILAGVFYVYAWPWIYWSIPALHGDDLPGLSDHWHANYVIKICDEIHPPLPYTLGTVHSHGDAQIHVHPTSPETAGRKANLSVFFDNAGGTITKTRIALPPRLDLSNGDSCAGGDTGELTVYVNKIPIENPPAYVPRDGDSVIIYFGPPVDPPALPARLKTINEPDTAAEP